MTNKTFAFISCTLNCKRSSQHSPHPSKQTEWKETNLLELRAVCCCLFKQCAVCGQKISHIFWIFKLCLKAWRVVTPFTRVCFETQMFTITIMVIHNHTPLTKQQFAIRHIAICGLSRSTKFFHFIS